MGWHHLSRGTEGVGVMKAMWIAGLSMPAGAPIGLRVGCGPTACLFIAAAAAAYPATASASLAADAAVRGRGLDVPAAGARTTVAH